MAPPTPRRSGFSKRAQYGTFFGYVAALAGAVVGGAVLIISMLDKDAFSGARGIAADLVAPAGKAVTAGRSGAQSASATLAGFVTSGSRVAAMTRELELARIRLAEARALADENRRLKALLGLRDGAVQPLAHGRLINATASSLRRFATISVGRDHGIAVGMPVRSPRGLVGRVLEVSSRTARVLLLTDPESVVPVKRARDGIPAFAQGHGDGTIQLRLISLGVNPLKPGDVFVTSGSGGLYRPGTAVGVVTGLTRDGAVARVLSDPTDSEFVAVEPVFAVSAGIPDALAPAGQPPRGAARPAAD
ncbi:MAG: rod shape-determining protein MreC [Pseudomonadota bacterium]